MARGTGTDAAVSTIRTALATGTQLAFDYRNARGETESRVVDPFLLESVDRDWYLPAAGATCVRASAPSASTGCAR
ncbi:WYL domain-containing protein [Rathayibacter oskolensis]|uniref:WYL domain-containing protein n=1 Tax=Rathayibacter oskolensis TaxID=1891671 RepID=UPI00265D940C|nr:WYL domain-containing protein [Rathayibacter oskolensis]WKK71285.1 WYL domain-containing protein [Rathayibacter oskolensis]